MHTNVGVEKTHKHKEEDVEETKIKGLQKMRNRKTQVIILHENNEIYYEEWEHKRKRRNTKRVY